MNVFVMMAALAFSPAELPEPIPDPIGQTELADTASNPIVCAILMQDWLNALDALIIAKEALAAELAKPQPDPNVVFTLSATVSALQAAADLAAQKYYAAGCAVPLPGGPGVG